MGSQPERSLGAVFFAGLASAVLCLALFGWLAGEVLEGKTLAFDGYVRALIHAHASPALTAVMRGLSEFGSPVALTVMGAALLIGLRVVHSKRAALLFLITMAGAFVLDATLKLGFQRARPVSFFGYPEPRSYSFPSGHALFSVCFFGYLAALVAFRARSRAARVAAWVAGTALALAIGYSRIYLGVHYPSDVLAGYAAAVVWVSAVAYGHRIIRRRRARKPVPQMQA